MMCGLLGATQSLSLQKCVHNNKLTAYSFECLTFSDILRSPLSAQKSLLSEVCVVAQLIFVMPTTNADSERSFSALRHVETCLWSTMN